MFQMTVTMDRVFSKACFRTKDEVHTEFGFESAGKKFYGVQVPGTPRIEEGMTVTILLREEGDWTSVCGWVDMQTGEIIAQGIGHSVFFVSCLLLIGIVVASSTRDPLPLLLCIPFILLYPMEIVPRQRIRRTLKEIYARSAAQAEHSKPT